MFDQPIVADEELFKKVNLGHEAEKFLKHDPQGRALAAKALQQWKECVYDFEHLKLETILAEPAKVAAIHQKMALARQFLVWMNETITDAARAEEELRARDDSDITID